MIGHPKVPLSEFPHCGKMILCSALIMCTCVLFLGQSLIEIELSEGLNLKRKPGLLQFACLFS
jgi:hypothetical protein